ncbi:hypothetical protein [Sinanaerobacter chloroacetimidivorans]|uniref:Uncharacterized protein n=1 Tax=Sinanaerobacter chloroacetimidivorans TaxID=2818044 RepID=A0A8J7W484_9FIRM|nr:hypothetical protein [Sinanaerobacter chloroacetimidivorans]MBR0599053.1 hypothetical protein [Sinanaerobacter chloroacetimidivorans]
MSEAKKAIEIYLALLQRKLDTIPENDSDSFLRQMKNIVATTGNIRR